MAVSPGVFGLTYFAGIKLAGYSAAGAYINHSIPVSRPRPIVFGIARTLIGLGAGITYAFALSRVDISNAELPFYAGLVPIRLVEWLAVLWLFYRTVPQSRDRWPRYVAAGIVWSFVLDLPAVFAAFALPGGVWIC